MTEPQPNQDSQPPPQYHYYYPAPLPPAPARPVNGMAIASMVLGILWLYWIGSILALIFGYNALRQIDEDRSGQTGRGMAIAGVTLGWVGIGLGLVLMVVAVAFSGY